MRAIRIGAVALLVLAAAAVAGVGLPEKAGGADSAPGKGITVLGTGTTKTTPDEATFSLGVSTDGSTARAALAANAAAMDAVIAAVKSAGVSAKDIRTQDVSVGPNYEGDSSPDGYTARNSVSVRITKLDRAGDVLDAASRAGANEVYGPMLSRSDREDFEAKALKDAFADARKRAEALADAAGVRLGAVTELSEAGGGGPVMYEAMRAAAVDVAKAPIEGGTEEIQASVRVTFAIE